MQGRLIEIWFDKLINLAPGQTLYIEDVSLSAAKETVRELKKQLKRYAQFDAEDASRMNIYQKTSRGQILVCMTKVITAPSCATLQFHDGAVEKVTIKKELQRAAMIDKMLDDKLSYEEINENLEGGLSKLEQQRHFPHMTDK